ncbi:MAG: hypothetical protein FDX30_00375 [Chlorobium sp.]|nr:MAG: hypothetical protein FDX30_00375 [Chlorobium sp.]
MYYYLKSAPFHTEFPRNHKKQPIMKKSVAGVLALAAMGMFCGVSYAADQVQTSGKQETVAMPGEKITLNPQPLPPKSHVKYKRVGKNWLNPQPEPPKPPDPTIKK